MDMRSPQGIASPELVVTDVTPSPVGGGGYTPSRVMAAAPPPILGGAGAPFEALHCLRTIRALVKTLKRVLLEHKLQVVKDIRTHGRYQEEVARQIVESCREAQGREAWAAAAAVCAGRQTASPDVHGGHAQVRTRRRTWGDDVDDGDVGVSRVLRGSGGAASGVGVDELLPHAASISTSGRALSTGTAPLTYRRQGSSSVGSIHKRVASGTASPMHPPASAPAQSAKSDVASVSLSLTDLPARPGASKRSGSGSRGSGVRGQTATAMPQADRGDSSKRAAARAIARRSTSQNRHRATTRSPTPREPNVVVHACVNETEHVVIPPPDDIALGDFPSDRDRERDPPSQASAFTSVGGNGGAKRDVLVTQGHDTRRFTVDTVYRCGEAVTEQARALLERLRNDGSCCVGVVSDGAALGQHHALNLASVLASSLPTVTPRPVVMRAVLIEGERYRDVFYDPDRAGGGGGGWAPLDGRHTLGALHGVLLADTQGVRAHLAALRAQRTQRRGAVMVVHLCAEGGDIGGDVDAVVVDLCVAKTPPSAASGFGGGGGGGGKTCRQVPTPQQAFCDVLASMRSRNTHHPIRATKVTALLGEIAFRPDVHHVLSVNVGCAPESVAAVSHALRVLHTAARVCGNQYVLRTD